MRVYIASFSLPLRFRCFCRRRLLPPFIPTAAVTISTAYTAPGTAPYIRDTGVNFRPTVCELPSHSSDSALTQPRAVEINADNNDDDEAGWRKTTAVMR